MKKACSIISGKGGVGKSIVSVNCAYELRKRGIKAGIIDADMDNSSIPWMLVMSEAPQVTYDKRLKPVDVDGVEVFSLGLISKESPVSMQGREHSEILLDVVQYGDWSSDCVLVDLPGGQSDEWKSVIQIFADSFVGSLIVTQPAHIPIAERLVKLHRFNGIPILGLIENMSFFACPECGKEYDIFGRSGATEDLSKKYELNYFGRIPLSIDVRNGVEKGRPLLPEELMEPVKNAMDVFLSSEPQRLGFLERAKERAVDAIKMAALKFAHNMLWAMNSVDIGRLQVQHGFPGGRVIQLNMMEDDLRTVLVEADFRIDSGRLNLIKNPDRIDVEIDIKARAMGWAILGEKPLPNGSKIPYDFATAFYMGDAAVFGSGDTLRAFSFFRDIWANFDKSGLAKLAGEIAAL